MFQHLSEKPHFTTWQAALPSYAPLHSTQMGRSAFRYGQSWPAARCMVVMAGHCSRAPSSSMLGPQAHLQAHPQAYA